MKSTKIHNLFCRVAFSVFLTLSISELTAFAMTESTLSEMDVESVDSEYGSKMERILNNNTFGTVEIYEEDLAVLTEYAEILENSYFTNGVPDFHRYMS